ncbi:hypothetical protein [Streptomyces griseorubiginosus]|uniref:hypothetical protein n=1 Tax=Streptomyces griseorubiginosus TaxID=67304 RepID=UPI003F53FE06
MEVPRRSWAAVTRRTFKELPADELADRAPALTSYGVLSPFPALLVPVSLLVPESLLALMPPPEVVGRRATDKLLDTIGGLTPGPARDILRDVVIRLGDSILQQRPRHAGVARRPASRSTPRTSVPATRRMAPSRAPSCSSGGSG